MPNVVNARVVLVVLGLAILFGMTGCFARESWTRTELFSPANAATSAQAVDATIESVAFLGGVQRGLNIDLDALVTTDQGQTKHIYLEQPQQLPVGIVMMKRIRVHFDAKGSPLFVEKIDAKGTVVEPPKK